MTKRAVSEPYIDVCDIYKDFDGLPVLNGVDFSVARGEVVCLIGPSGSGKSTLLRCINALTKPERGTINVSGVDVTSPKLDSKNLRRKVGMVFQNYNLFPHRTALQNIMMAPIQVSGRPKQEVEHEARALLKKVRLEHKAHAYPGELSGGQQQRIAIARSLCMKPEIMLFDEVTAALDPETVKEVLSVIKEIAAEGLTCILVTHEMRFAKEVADYLYFLDQGKVVEHGTAKDMFSAPSDPRTRAFLEKVL